MVLENKSHPNEERGRNMQQRLLKYGGVMAVMFTQAFVVSISHAQEKQQEKKLAKTSYAPVSITEPFEAIMSRTKAAKSAVMKSHMNMLKERKGKSRLQCFIEKHGEEIGKQKYEAFRKLVSDKKKGCKPTNTLECFITKYGEEIGKEKHKQFSNKMKNTKHTIEGNVSISNAKKLWWKNKKGES